MKNTPRTLKILALVFLAVSLVLSNLQPAAALRVTSRGSDERRATHPETGMLSFLGAEPGNPIQVPAALAPGLTPEARALALLMPYAAEFGLRDPQRELSLRSTRSQEGRQVTRFQQLYQGLPVLGGEIVVNASADGRLLSINGEVSPALALGITPALSEAEARQAALQTLAKWYDFKLDGLSASQPALWIYDSRLLETDGHPAALVWRMEVSGPDMRELVLVDAVHGGVALHFNQIDALQAPAVLWYAAPEGSDANTCASPAEPCKSIRAAVNKSGIGDEVRVASGVYIGSGVEVVPISHNLSLSGGWDASFTSQSGFSVINGELLRRGVSVGAGIIASMNHFVIQNGVATQGGGVANQGVLTLDTVLVQYNRGAGLYNLINAVLTINNSTVLKNTGSGIYNIGSMLYVNNSTIAGNEGFKGGGIYNGSTAVVRQATITGNYASDAGGGLDSYAQTLEIRQSILAGNMAPTSPDCTRVNNTYENIIGLVSGCTLSFPYSYIPGDGLKLGAMIGLPGYFPLLSNSAGRNSGSACLPTDQRGLARPALCDLGAYQSAAPGAGQRLGSFAGEHQGANSSGDFDRPLSVFVTDEAGTPLQGVVVNFRALPDGPALVFADSGQNHTSATSNAQGIATSAKFSAFGAAQHFTVRAEVGAAALDLLENDFTYVSTSGSDANPCDTPALACASVRGALAHVPANGLIRMAGGTYTGSGDEVILLDRDVYISGGWNTGFSAQSGMTVIDGQSVRSVLTVGRKVTATVERLTLQNGKASSSSSVDPQGGVSNQGVLILNQCVIQDNNGYGIFNAETALLAVNNCAITGNWSGIYNFTGAKATVNASLIRANQERGIINYWASLMVNNTTISDNEAPYSVGGGIDNDTGVVLLNNDTIINNQNSGISNDGGTVTVSNSIITLNTLHANPNFVYPDCYGTVASAGYNLTGVNGCFSSANPSDRASSDPGLSAMLIGNPGYYPPLANSPAVDNGNPATCLPADQRGISRPQGNACDIGAVEYAQVSGGQAASLGYVSGSDQQTSAGAGFLPLAVFVMDAQNRPVSGVTVTFSGPTVGTGLVFSNNSASIQVLSDGNGIASASARANNLVGTFEASASASGLGMVNFTNLTTTVWAPRLETHQGFDGLINPGPLLCTESVTNCTNGANPDADKAHTFARGVLTFFKDQHGRNSYDNQGANVISAVNYTSPNQFPNAFWNGHYLIYSPYMVADDVAAHEFTHAVTENESNLFYYYQSGAINESFSDIWGELYDQANGLGNDSPGVRWWVGEDAIGGAIRSMSNPPTFGDPDNTDSALYAYDSADNGGVHTNSGINNKAAYLMIDGGSFNGRTVSGLGADKTLAIYYEAQTNLLTSGADYPDLYQALYQACLNLVDSRGIVSGDCQQVRNATEAVLMNLRPPANPGISADVTLCGSASQPVFTTFYDDLEDGTANWTLNNIGYHKLWQYDSPYGDYAHSGVHFLYGDDYGAPGDIADVNARLRAISIPPNARLHFSHAFDFEVYSNRPYDGGVLEYSLDNGVSWQDAGWLMEANGYTGTIYLNSENPLARRPAFTGSSVGYTSTRLNLGALAGRSVSFRWRMGLDNTGYRWGWWLDDVRVYQCGYRVSGNAGVANVSLSYLDGSYKTVSSDASGNYTLDVSPGWTGVVTPLKACTAFSPDNRSYNGLAANQDAQNYSAGALIPQISGSTGLPGVSLHYFDGVEKNVTSDANGNYVISVPCGWSGMLTPSLSGYSFRPASREYTSLGGLRANHNFTPLVSISGSTGSGGVTQLSYWDDSAQSVFSNPDGSYSLPVPYNWSGDVTPSRRGAIFTPLSRSYVQTQAALVGQDYSASAGYDISGNAGVGAASLTFTDDVEKRVWTDAGGNYLLTVSPGWSGTVTPARPGQVFSPLSKSYENLSANTSEQNYSASALATFSDVPVNQWAWQFVETLAGNGITSGCANNPRRYCPSDTVTRAEMAVFLLRARHGTSYQPPMASGVFADVPVNYWAARWIEQLAAEGITGGCSNTPRRYCPDSPVMRDQMAVFLLRAAHGASYAPPTPLGQFADVPLSQWASSWIEQLAAEGITGGCASTPRQYCPGNPVTRDQMAVFLVRAFGLK